METERLSQSDARHRNASMGPRLFGRGNQYIMGSAKACAVLQWGHAFSDVETDRSRRARRRRRSFNGATPFRTWKLVSPCDGLLGQRKLQWGHAFSDVETLLVVPDR